MSRQRVLQGQETQKQGRQVLKVRVVRRLALLGTALLAAIASAETLTGRVVGITDGDTITLLDGNRRQHKVRLAGIDAPEKSQPFGQRSKQNLSDLVYRQDVVIEWSKRDRYGRIVGKVLTANGQDACLEQIWAGMAWWYRKYANEQSPYDQRAYAEAEEQAKADKRGLWQDARPVPPWEWRKR
jgi:endonuclease YncB( thermonuclease family)